MFPARGHISRHSLRHAAITIALEAGVPLRDLQIFARHAEPRTTQHYDRACGNFDRHGVHSLTAYLAGVLAALELSHQRNKCVLAAQNAAPTLTYSSIPSRQQLADPATAASSSARQCKVLEPG